MMRIACTGWAAARKAQKRVAFSASEIILKRNAVDARRKKQRRKRLKLKRINLKSSLLLRLSWYNRRPKREASSATTAKTREVMR